MRVVAATVFFPRGGSAFVARELARTLDADVTLVAGSTAEHDARAFYGGLDLRAVDFGPALRSAEPARYAGGPGEAPIHGSFEDREDAPDPVFARLDDDAYTAQVDAWARALRDADAAGADVLHLHHLTPVNAAAQEVAPDVPVVTQLHGTELLMLEAIEHGAGWAYGAAWAERLRAWAAASARLVVAPGNVARAATLLGLPPERLVALPNGFDPDVFGPREVDRAAVWRRVLPGAPDVAGGTVFLYVGRFTKVKRVPRLIEAFAAARARMTVPASLVLVGGYPGEWEGEHPEDAIDRLEVEGTHLAGWHEHDDLAELLAASDVLALASERESFGQVIVEAMACGVAPVVTAAEGPATIVEDGETGWVVPVDDPAALADALAAAASDPSERARRAARATEIARERYAWPAVAARLDEVLRGVVR
jgi:glycosyltransferase involved in cell wall biosynthesis